MNTTIYLEHFVPHEDEGLYLTVPFIIDEDDIVELEISYDYTRYEWEEEYLENGTFRPRKEINIIDIGLIAPDGSQVGASGSDKSKLQVTETEATPGYHPRHLDPGEWQIILGAYKVAPEGVKIFYTIETRIGETRLLKGDLHTHTVASDGVLTLEELGLHARAHRLDFLAVTDHNQPISGDALPKISGLTMIPGIEWTHYKGHANFTGADAPFDGSFMANTPGEVQSRFEQARDCGALITLNHPFDEGCPFLFDMDALPWDCYEVWNGPMRMSNIQAVAIWHGMLASGKKVPIVGGSDYHRSQPFLFLGGPTTCVYARTAGKSDILDALRRGHAYIVYAPDGPMLEFTSGEAMMGDSLPFSEENEVQIKVKDLHAGDILQIVTNTDSFTLLEAEFNGDFEGVFAMSAPGFARVVILREFVPGVPKLPALLSNPIYFD